MKEEILFWSTVAIITLGSIAIIGEFTGLVDTFINSFN